MADYDHPLTNGDDLDRDEVCEMSDVDVRATMSSDGKRLQLTITDQNGDEGQYRLGGLKLNGTPIRAKEPVTLYDVDAVIEWQAGGLGLYPGVNVKVTPPTPEATL